MAEIEVAVEDGILLATLNRPERMNSLSPGLLQGLQGALDRASRDDDVRVMVLTGNGRAFCAGAEVSGDSAPAGGTTRAVAGTRFDAMRTDGPGSVGMVKAFAACHVPVIGAINGVAAGGGFGISLCCDVRILAESARMGPIFIRRGIATDYGTGYWLARIVGVAKAYELLYDGGVVDSGRALELGLANRVVPDDEFMPEVMKYARQIAAGPPLAYTATRRNVLDSVDNLSRDAFSQREWAAQTALLTTKDAAEGFRSFLERREPSFTGE